MSEERYPALYAPTEGYVFVVTYGRSGSTLTQVLLNAIPGWCIRGENGNLLYHLARAVHVTRSGDNYAWRRNDLGKPRLEQKNFLRDIIGTPSDPWYGVEHVLPDRFALKLFDDFVSQVIRPPENARVLGFKEIRWHEDRKFFHNFLDIVKEHFPGTRFLFQTRDADSLSRSSWWKQKEPGFVTEMVTSVNRMFHDYTAENPGTCLMVEYERFEEGPSYVKEIFDFLGEPMDEAVIRSILDTRLTHLQGS